MSAAGGAPAERLDAELRRLRLLAARRALWLRSGWRNDPLERLHATVVSDAQVDRLLAGDAGAAERFYREDADAARLGDSIREVEAELDELAAAAPVPLDGLERAFGLDRFERDVVLLCAAPQLDPAFERVYAYLNDDAGRPYATPQLARALFGPGPARAFLADAPLRRWRLVTLEPQRGEVPAVGRLVTDERVLDHLAGVDLPDARLRELARPAGPVPAAPAHERLAESLAGSLAGLGAGRELPTIELAGAGGEAVAHALAARLGLRLARLDARRFPADGVGAEATLRLLERESALSGACYWLPAPGEAEAAAAASIATGLRAFLMTGGPGGPDAVHVDVPPLDAAGRRALWQRALGAGSPKRELALLVEQFDLGPAEVAGAVSSATASARLRGAASPSDDELATACRAHAGSEIGALAERIDTRFDWDDIVLPADGLRQLREVAAQAALRPEVYERWGFGRKLGRGRGVTALFAGPSGTGKTMAAEILARDLRLDLYRVDLAGVVSKYIGETEKNLRRVFDAAERSGALLLFDEADSLFGKRTDVKDGHDRYANVEVNYLLQRMESYRGLALLATNRRGAIDPAFMRRIRFVIDFPFPDGSSRRSIWQRVFPSAAPLEELDWEELARMELSGGSIRVVALNAAFLAAAERRAIGMADVMSAARREYAKLGRLADDAQFGRWEQAA